jgi:hypothetical protein
MIAPFVVNLRIAQFPVTDPKTSYRGRRLSVAPMMDWTE